MFNTLFELTHKFHHGQSMQLRLIVPLCMNTVMLFYNDCTFFHYSLSQKKSIYHSKLPGTPYKALAISEHKIVVSIVETRSIILLDIPQHQMFLVLSQIPTWSIIQQVKCRQIFFQTWMESFHDTGGLIIAEKNIDEKKMKFSFGNPQVITDFPKFNTKSISIKDSQYQKIDEVSSIAVYKQTPQQNKFKFTVYDMMDNSKQTQYTLQHKSFNSLSTIRSIKKINQHSFIIFINGAKPNILIYNRSEVKQIIIGSPRIFLSSLYIDPIKQYGLFLFLSTKNIQKHHNIDVVNINNGSIIDSYDCTIKELKKAWSDNYFVNYQREKKNNFVTTFTTKHLINKQSHYLMILENLFPDNFNHFRQSVLQILQ